MNGKIKRLLCLMMALATVVSMFIVPATASAAGATVYVSPTGNDSTGNGSINSPYKTIEKAKAAVSGSASGATIYLRGGDYYITKEVQFNSADSGTKGNPVKYVAYNGEKVNLYGGSKIPASKITTASTTVSSRVLNATAKSKLLQIDLSSMYPNGIPKYYTYGNTADENKYPFQVYCGEIPLSRSRWPNADAAYPYVKTTKKAEQVSGGSNAGAAYRYYYSKMTEAVTRVNSWSSAAAEDLFVHGFWAYEYNTEDCRVTELNKTAKSMTIVGGINSGDWKTASTDTYLAGCRFYFFNLPEEIDQPGECYIDYDKSTVYFYPPAGFDANNVFVSNLMDSMFGFYNAHDIVLDGLSFKYMRRNAIDIRNLKGYGYSTNTYQAYRGITIQNCTIAHSSGNAISACGTDIKVLNCNIYDTGSGGVIMYGGAQQGLVNANSTVANCSITNFTRNEHTYEPAIEAASLGMLISHNKISGGIHQAIGSYGFTNNITIEYNEIFNCVTEAFDMGAVYYGRTLSVLGTVIRYNYFHDLGSSYTSSMQHAIYIDDGAFGAEIYGNVFYKASSVDYEPAAIKLHAAQFSKIYNNIFIDMPYGIEDAAWTGYSSGYQQQWIKYIYNTDYALYGPPKHFGFDSGIWKSTYSGTIWGEQIWKYFSTEKINKYTTEQYKGEALPSDALVNGAVPYKTNKITDNVYYKMAKGHVYDVWTPNCNHLETNSYDATSTSIFTNYGKDFSLTSSGLSTVKSGAKNFENIPFSSIGPTTDFEVPSTPGGTTCEHTAGAAATCTTAQSCTKCGVTLVSALGHNIVGNSCTRCGATISVVNKTYHFDLYDDVDGSETGKNSDGSYGMGKLTTLQNVSRAQVAASAASKTLDPAVIGAAQAHKVFLDSNSGNIGMSWITASPDNNSTIGSDGYINGDAPYIAYRVTGSGSLKELTVKLHAGNLADTRYALYIASSLKYTNASTGQLDFSGAQLLGTAGADGGKTFYTDAAAESYNASDAKLSAIGNPADFYVILAINNTKALGSSDSGRLSGLATTNCRYTALQINASFSGSAAAHTHSMTLTAAKAATCQTAGNSAYYTCSGCGKYFSDASGNTEITLASTVIAKKDHTYGTTYKNDASGHWFTCTVCSAKGTVNAHVPNVTEATTATAKYCVLCNYIIQQQIIPSHTHSMIYTPAKAATCQAVGNTAYYFCSGCGKYYADAAGNTEITLASTVVAMTAHKNGSTFSSDANGHWYSCTVCGTKGTVNPHVPNVVAATEATAKYCVLCTYVIEPKLEPGHTHAMTYTAAKAATCQAAGNTAYYHCVGCGKYFADASGKTEITYASTVIAVKAHSYGTAYKSDASGHWFTCTVCSAKGTVNSHVPNASAPTTSTAQYCVLCNYVIANKLEDITDPNPPSTLVGDTNGDNKKDINDVNYMLNHMLFGAASYPKYQDMDYNNDGKLTTADSIVLLNSVIFGA